MLKKIVLTGLALGASFLSFHLGHADTKATITTTKAVACDASMCYGESCPNEDPYIHSCCCQ